MNPRISNLSCAYAKFKKVREALEAAVDIGGRCTHWLQGPRTWVWHLRSLQDDKRDLDRKATVDKDPDELAGLLWIITEGTVDIVEVPQKLGF